jgi:hypothetical protein
MLQQWRHRFGCVAVLALLALLWPQRARAVPGFPREVQRDLALDYEPPCSLCHVKNNTGVGTARTPFALSMRDYGLSADDRASLSIALTGLAQDNVDSDGDGVSDTNELKAGTDPNSDANVSLKGQTVPEWGCAVAQRSAAADGGAWTTALALIAALLVSRRKATRTRSVRFTRT